MVKLYDSESDKLIGTITGAELQFLKDQLEEETLEDQDYYIDPATLVWFEEQGADSSLVALLREALGDREGMEIRWAED
jgi:processive 1,2-diacylglycerol beta-glucosyltransferase